MPQLMPLMWMGSVCMFVYMLFVLIMLYNYKELYKLNNFSLNSDLVNINLLW